MTKFTDEQIDALVETLGCSIAEAEQILLDDEIINKGGRCDWEPSVEEEKAMRKATKLVADRKKSATGTVKRERKENTAKRTLVAMLAQALADNGINADITNIERMLAFEFEGENYELTLVQKRKGKAK